MFYFDWLQKDNPTGIPDRFPALKDTYETSVPGLYCAGDLTGIPLIKLAAESGYELIERLSKDTAFARQQRNRPDDMYDLIIVGAGPAGVSACLHAAGKGFKHLLIESTQKFNTIVNFPAGKPIYVTPEDPPMKSALHFSDGTKETLLEELRQDIQEQALPIHEGETVKRITSNQDYFEVQSDHETYTAIRVIVAIGKTGNARMLGVPGDKLPKVFTRLIDPGEFRNKNCIVVGGGDSALEAAVALADTGNRVTLSYRRDSLSRPKEHNQAAFEQRVQQGAITPLLGSSVTEITPDSVVVKTRDGEQKLDNDVVFELIGTEFPIQFFRRSNIRMEGEKRFADWVKIAALLLFASVLYFGKKAPVTAAANLGEFFSIPIRVAQKPWHMAFNGMAAWISLLALAVCTAYLTGHFIKRRHRYFTSAWNSFKYSYYFAMLALFAWLYLSYKILDQRPILADMGGWYTAFYSVTIVIFGLGRIARKPTGYIKRQTYALMAIQVIPLFILPMFVFPALGERGLLGDWVMANVFPGGSYWRSYGFILAWPLFIHNLATSQPTAFWLWTGVLQTFVIIPLIVYKWGKGSYCGWICSCGALAETLGDEYRTQAPHGPAAKQWENAGQYVLWFAGLTTLLALFAGAGGSAVSSLASNLYAVIVDIIFAGVLGVGVYFFMSGRVWCRFLCPLAALMHIYARFSPYRIFANKKRCISCNICTKVCHMGIDVMSFANKGEPMNDVECVRCSACVVNCPMQVLTFGSLDGPDLDNTRYRSKKYPLVRGWQSGLPKQDIDTLIEQEKERGSAQAGEHAGKRKTEVYTNT